MGMPSKGMTQLDTSWCDKALKVDVGQGFGSESHVHVLVSLTHKRCKHSWGS